MVIRPYRLIADKFGLIYYTTPKAACTSIRKTLGVHGQSNDRGRNLDEIAHYLSFTAVRNPWDRIVSLYSDFVHIRGTGTHVSKLKRLCNNLDVGLDVSWPEFVRAIGESTEDSNIHYRSQYLLHPVEPVDLLIRFENLLAGWDRLRVLRPGLPELRHNNKTGHDPFEAYYTVGQAEVIAERYGTDIAKYGYVSP